MTSHDVDLSFEIGTLRHVPRNWAQFGGLSFANVAEHSFRVAWLAMIIAAREGADPGRAAVLALVHDAAETRVGDLNYVQRMHVEQHVDAALDGTLHATSIETFARAAWTEWTQRETLEAKAAHDADVIDCDLELRERGDAGAALPEVLSTTRQAAAAKLATSAGVAMWRDIQTSSSHDWHMRACNRLNSGDWKETRPGV